MNERRVQREQDYTLDVLASVFRNRHAIMSPQELVLVNEEFHQFHPHIYLLNCP